MKNEVKIVRKYHVSFGELKKALGIKGELVESNLWSGLSPRDEEAGVSRDKETVEIVTEEVIRETKQ